MEDKSIRFFAQPQFLNKPVSNLFQEEVLIAAFVEENKPCCT